MDVAARKQALRARLSAVRIAQPPSAAAARAAAALVVGTPEFRAAGAVALYAALGEELSTLDLYEAAREAGKRVALPRVRPGRRLDWAWIGSFDELRPGRYGVLEPVEGSPLAFLDELDWVLVPGVAFDREGWRLGRGAGYYDRELSARQGRRPFLVGFALSTQIVEEVPIQEFDQRMDAVVTEREWIEGKREP